MTVSHFTDAVPEGHKGSPPSAVLPELSSGGHRPSHLSVVGRIPRYFAGADQAELPAVIVPTSRPLSQSRIGLELAARCAEARDAQLVVIRSGQATRDPFPPELSAVTSRPTIVIDLPDGVPDPLPTFANAQHPVASLHRTSDLGLKRNLALLMGLLCGWETLMLLDDDITTRRASRLHPQSRILPAAVALRLDDVFAEFAHNKDLKAAGYLQKDFDDNSVVCHVRKLAGLDQEGFISGGALVVRCDDEIPFFPAAYNEDWLFLFAVMLQDRHSRPSSGVKRIGSVHQAAYYPFAAPRARGEELGDAFAEGLFALLDNPAAEIEREAGSLEYWKHVVHKRKSMIAGLLVRFQTEYGPTDHEVINNVESCLRAALDVYPGTLAESAGLMTSYFDVLTADLHTWYDLIEGLAPGAGGPLSLPAALSALNIDAHVHAVPHQGARWLPRPRSRRASVGAGRQEHQEMARHPQDSGRGADIIAPRLIASSWIADGPRADEHAADDQLSDGVFWGTDRANRATADDVRWDGARSGDDDVSGPSFFAAPPSAGTAPLPL